MNMNRFVQQSTLFAFGVMAGLLFSHVLVERPYRSLIDEMQRDLRSLSMSYDIERKSARRCREELRLITWGDLGPQSEMEARR